MSAFDHIDVPTEIDALVAFTDLTLFSRFASSIPGPELFATLSDYYELVGDIATESGGQVIKFIGDTALIAYPEEQVGQGVQGLLEVQARGDAFWQQKDAPCRHYIRLHFGTVTCGPIGTREKKQFDLFGATVNTAATVQSHGFAMTPQVFRKLDPETRKLFKKHTPPITYIAAAERHRDN